MAESSVPVTSGAGNNVDTFTLASTGNKRQSVVVGDSSVDANVAPVQSTDPVSNAEGLVVRDVNTSAIVGKLTSGVPVTGTLTGITNTVAVYFDRGNPAVNITNASIPITSSGTLQVFLPDTGHELGTIRGNTNTLTVFLPDTGHTLGKVDQGVGGNVTAWTSNIYATASLFTTAGSVTGVSVSGNTILSPSASYNFKIYGFSLFTTGVTSILAKWVNGSGASQTEFWRAMATGGNVEGVDAYVTPPGYLFATGLNTTLALLLDSGSLVHYSVAYIKESS